MGLTRRAVITGGLAGVGLACAGFPRRSPLRPGRAPAGRGELAFAVQSWDDRVDGQERTSLVLVPPTYDPSRSWPLVLFSHGHDQDARTAIERFGWGKTCHARGYIGVFPNTGSDFTRGNDDNEYFLRLLDRAQTELAVDPRRIYAGGFSGGCRRAYSFAANHSERITALAVHSGTIGYAQEAPEEWDPRRPSIHPISLIHLHGARDAKVSPRGGVLTPAEGATRLSVSMRDGMEAWADALHATFERDAPPPAGVPLRCAHYEWRTADGHLLVGVVDPDLGHEFFPYASEAFVDFFARVPLRAI